MGDVQELGLPAVELLLHIQGYSIGVLRAWALPNLEPFGLSSVCVLCLLGSFSILRPRRTWVTKWWEEEGKFSTKSGLKSYQIQDFCLDG